MAEKPSGQRTEKPTPKRLREARRKGQIPRSPDLVGWVGLLAATYVIPPVQRSSEALTPLQDARWQQVIEALENLQER